MPELTGENWIFLLHAFVQPMISLRFSDIQTKQTVPVAVKQDLADAVHLESGFGISFRIKLHHLDLVGGQCREKGNMVCLPHIMLHMDKVFVFDLLYRDPVVFIWLLWLAGGKQYSMAVDHGFSHGMDAVSADRTHIELSLIHI